jgi:hypothetical protein
MVKDILTLCPSNVRWEVQVRDYVENISLGLPSARLSEQLSLTIVDDDRRGRNHTFVVVNKLEFKSSPQCLTTEECVTMLLMEDNLSIYLLHIQD